MDELVNKVKILVENKIEYFKDGSVEIRFSPDAFLPSYETPHSESGELDEEDLLFASSGVKRVKREQKERKS